MLTARVPMPAVETLVVTDAGLETWLLFEREIDLPAFAAYPLAGTPEGREVLTDYYRPFVDIAESANAALLLDTPTWRASPDWAATLGHDETVLTELIAASVDVVDELRRRHAGDRPFLVGGALGPRGDGYQIDFQMTADAAAEYHSFQIDRMAELPIDVVSAVTIGYVDEAVGISRAAAAAGLDVVVSFTVETDGRLPSGQPLAEAIIATDGATDAYPRHYMVNCAHPSHFEHVLDAEEAWTKRIGGVRANASTLSHAELDEATELDAGDPEDLATRYAALRKRLASLHVVGGCCGTDHRHVAAIATRLSATGVNWG